MERLRLFRKKGEDHACLSICYVSCSHRSYDEPWLLDITQALPSLACAVGAECPSRSEDFAEPPHYRPVHWRRLQVRVVL
jgi:hypothetical protein